MGAEYLDKILAVERILIHNPYGITTKEIISKLESIYGIKAERKSIYSNIAVLTRFLPIDVRTESKTTFWYIRTGVE